MEEVPVHRLDDSLGDPQRGAKKSVCIRSARPEDHHEIMEIASTLPEWFDEDARTRAIPTDLRHQTVFVAQCGDRVVGFVTLYFAEGRLQIGWLGVHRRFHRQGIGRRLVARSEEFGRQAGCTELATYTLGPRVDYEPYEETRAFYFACGFSVYVTSVTDNPGCPQEIKIKKRIAATS